MLNKIKKIKPDKIVASIAIAVINQNTGLSLNGDHAKYAALIAKDKAKTLIGKLKIK